MAGAVRGGALLSAHRKHGDAEPDLRAVGTDLDHRPRRDVHPLPALSVRAPHAPLSHSSGDRSAGQGAARRLCAAALRVRDRDREEELARGPSNLASSSHPRHRPPCVPQFDECAGVAVGGGSRYRYLITQPFIWLHYFRLFFLPAGLTADTDWTTFDHWYDTRAVAGYLFLVLLAVWMIRSFRRDETRAVTFGIAWFAIALIPTSIFPLAEVANE